MIRQSIEIYGKLLRGMLVLGVGGGIFFGSMAKMKVSAKRSLVKGLVQIPVIKK